MRTATFAALMALLLAGPGAAAGQTPGTRADEDAVRALVARYVEAREARDGTAIGALFTADADQFTTGGEWRQGRDTVVTGALASSARTGGTRNITVRRVRFVTPDVALADGPYDIAGTGDGTRHLWTTFVLVRQPGGWRIAAIRNASPTAIPE